MGFLELFIIFLVLAALVVGITLWITGGSGKGNGEMSCGGCGYAVRGLQGVNCPECGADLRKVGISEPKGAATRNLGIFLTVGTLLLLLTCMGSIFFFSVRSSSPVQAVPTQAVPPPSVNQSSGGSSPAVDGEESTEDESETSAE